MPADLVAEPSQPRRTVTPYLWPLHRALSRQLVREQRRATRRLAHFVDWGQLGTALRAVTGLQSLGVECSLPVLSTAPVQSLGAHVTLKSTDDSLFVQLSVQPALLNLCASKLLDRKHQREDPRLPLEGRTLGLLAALALELAQRAAPGTPLVLADDIPPEASGGLLFSMAFALGDHQYAGSAWLSVLQADGHLVDREPSASVQLHALGRLPVAVPLCVGACSALPQDLGGLELGDVWLAGGGYWLSEGRGRGALIAPGRGQGLGVELSQAGIVYRGQTVTIPTDLQLEGSADPAALPNVVLDTPVVVRLELGSVTLSAREWAEVREGDVLETRQPVGTPVVLRVAGQELARGQLVTVEGEIGVRITQIQR